MADLQKRKYRKTFLVWTSRKWKIGSHSEATKLTSGTVLEPALRDRIDKTPIAREQIALFKVLNVEFFPRESHLITFRDPWSFFALYHPACNNLVKQHLEDVAQKVSFAIYVLMFLVVSNKY